MTDLRNKVTFLWNVKKMLKKHRMLETSQRATSFIAYLIFKCLEDEIRKHFVDLKELWFLI